MIKTLFKSIRSFNTQAAFHRVQMLHRHHKLFLIALMEPFQDSKYIQKHKRRNYIYFNQNGKIYFFMDESIIVEILLETRQHITMKFFYKSRVSIWLVLLNMHNVMLKYLISTLVYAQCNALERWESWDSIYGLERIMNLLAC